MTAEVTTPARPDPGRLLEGKVALVTGASRGIGATTAHAFAHAGAAVVLAARSEYELTELAGQITGAGGHALPVAADVTDPTAVQRLVDRTLAHHGRLDAAFNNAGQGHQPTPLAELPVDDFDRALSVNARGVFLAVAATVTWLCSDQASFITGAAIAIDGGKLAGGA